MRTPLRSSYAALVAAVLTIAGVSYTKPVTYSLPEETSQLRPGPGMDTAHNSCLKCHSADYINTQPPNLGTAFWEAEVTKMIKAYHGPISEADATAIVDYLTKTY